MTFLYMARTGVSLFAACLFVSVYAIAPEWQRVPKGVGKLDSVVRVYGDDGAGTGSVIAKIPDPFDQNYYLLCVLTANHVVWDDGHNPNLKVGFHNKGAPNALDYRAFVVAEGKDKEIYVQGRWTKPDLAILGVRVPRMDFFDRLRPFDLGFMQPERSPFSVVGYGVTGDRFDKDGDGSWDGYMRDRMNRDHDYGVKRFANNIISKQKLWYEENRSKWYYWAMEWHLRAIGPGVGGHGNAWPGDSGAPYLNYSPWEIEVETPDGPEVLDVFTDNIIGVHTAGLTVTFGGDNRFQKKFLGFWSRGVPMLPEYREWIEMECMNVPEPASMTALLVGTLYVLARRRRKSKA